MDAGDACKESGTLRTKRKKEEQRQEGRGMFNRRGEECVCDRVMTMRRRMMPPKQNSWTCACTALPPPWREGRKRKKGDTPCRPPPTRLSCLSRKGSWTLGTAGLLSCVSLSHPNADWPMQNGLFICVGCSDPICQSE